MKLTSLVAVSILLCVFVTSFSFISPAHADAYLKPKGPPNMVKYQETETIVIWGEIENDGDVPADSIWITANLADYEGWPLDIAAAAPMLSVIHPGESSPFEITYTGSEFEGITTVSFTFEFSPTDALPQGLEIVSHSSASPGTVDGEVKNVGTAPTTQIIVAAAFYNPGGVVVGTASSDPIPGPLNPGQNATFSIALEYADLLPDVDSYALFVQSQEYTVIPEFPIWTSMLLILVMLTVATVVFRRRMLKTPIH